MRRLLTLCAAVAALIGLSAGLRAADKSDDTPAAKDARAQLKYKVTCDYKDTTIPDILDDLSDQVKDQIKDKSVRPLKFKLRKGDLSIKLNHNFTYSAKDVTVEEALDKILGPVNWGYVIISQQGNAYDGLVEIHGESKERGYPADSK